MADKFHYMTGKIHWAKVFQLVDNYNRDGKEWTFDFTPDADGMALMAALDLMDKMKNKEDARETFIQFRQREKRADGQLNFPITVCDARNRMWDPRIVDGKVTNPIGNMSTVEVKFKKVDYGKGKPVGVYPQAIRVLELAPYVRQEFAPLPEDNEYVQKLDEFPPVADALQQLIDEGRDDHDPLNDPLED